MSLSDAASFRRSSHGSLGMRRALQTCIQYLIPWCSCTYAPHRVRTIRNERLLTSWRSLRSIKFNAGSVTWWSYDSNFLPNARCLLFSIHPLWETFKSSSSFSSANVFEVTMFLTKYKSNNSEVDSLLMSYSRSFRFFRKSVTLFEIYIYCQISWSLENRQNNQFVIFRI